MSINLSGYTPEQWLNFVTEAKRCQGIYKYQKNVISRAIIRKIKGGDK